MDDDDGSPSSAKAIAYSEDFRRAIRNSLLWSALAIVAGIGRSTAPDVNVTFLGAGLAFNPFTLCGGAVVGAAYMFALYVRAAQRLTFENSRPKIEAKAGEMMEVIDALIGEAQEARTVIGRAPKLAEAFQQECLRRMQEMVSRLTSWMDFNPLVMELEQLRMAAKHFPLSSESASEISLRFNQAIDERVNSLKQRRIAANEQSTAIFELANAELPKSSDIEIDKQSQELIRFDTATRRLTESRKDLHQFHKDIAHRELRWHWSLDVVGVWLFFLLGLTTSGSRLIGYPPADLVPWLNPDTCLTVSATQLGSQTPPCVPPARTASAARQR